MRKVYALSKYTAQEFVYIEYQSKLNSRRFIVKFIKASTKLSAPLIVGSISASLLFSPSVQAGYFDCLDDIPPSYVEITDYTFDQKALNEYLDTPSTLFEGIIRNSHPSETIKQVFVDMEIMECNNKGKSCIVLDRQTVKLLPLYGGISRIGVPPYQARKYQRGFYDITLSDSFVPTTGKRPYFRYTVDSVCVYSYLERLFDD